MHEKFLTTINYTPTVTIKTAFADDFVELTVKDNGKGIPDTEVKQLFSPFFTTKPTAIGTGLGLFMSQDIVRMHKGSITVDTEEGRYAAFTVRLPVS